MDTEATSALCNKYIEYNKSLLAINRYCISVIDKLLLAINENSTVADPGFP